MNNETANAQSLETQPLERLSRSQLELGEGSEDLRGRKVTDAGGEALGTVEDLLVDPTERRVRFLQVGSGGFLGLGREHTLVPVEAVASTDGEAVRVGATLERVGSAPAYDPELTLGRDEERGVFEHYGVAPYWSAQENTSAGVGHMPYPVGPGAVPGGAIGVPPSGVGLGAVPERDLPPKGD